MTDFETLARTLGTTVLRHTGEGTITYVSPNVRDQFGYEPAELRGRDVAQLFPAEGRGAVRGHFGDREGNASTVRTETEVVSGNGDPIPVELRGSSLPDSDEVILSIRNLEERRQRERYLQFARDVNELVIRADDEATLVREMIATVTDRQFGCTSIGLLDERGELDRIYGVMEDWCRMDWEAAYTPDYIAEVLAEGDIVIEDVTSGPHRQHTVEEADHGAIALTLSHRGTRYGILTMHLAGKGSDLSAAERDLLRELADNVSTGIHNLRTEAQLRQNRKQLAVLDRVLRHNLRNALDVVIGKAKTVAEGSSGEYRRHAELIHDRAMELLETADTEREIVELIVENPSPTEIDLVPRVENCVEECLAEYPDAEITTDLPDTARVAAIPEVTRAIQELLENAVVHNDRDVPGVTVGIDRGDGETTVRIADDGPGIPDQETAVLTRGREIDPLGHGSGLALWLVNWIVDLSGGDVQFSEREPRGSVVRIVLRSAEIE